MDVEHEEMFSLTTFIVKHIVYDVRFVNSVHPLDREAYTAAGIQVTPENPAYKISYRVLRPDGSVIWLEVRGHALFDQKGRKLGVRGMVADVTERKLAEEALSSLSRRLIETQEQERTSIARELHDDLSQRMALLQIGLEEFEQDTAELTSKARKQLHHLTEVASEVSSDLHSISHRLHPAKLDLQGLVGATESFCRELSSKHELQIKFLYHDVPGQIPKDVALCLFRIVQEALRNVVKHGKTSEAKVELSGHGDGIDLCISDRGVGFDLESAKGEAGLGLISMRERLRLVGGYLSVESDPSRGTRIFARAPLFEISVQATDEAKEHAANA